MASAGSVCVDSRGIETRREEEVTRARAVRHAGERCVLVRDGTLPVVRGAATVPILVMERACGSGVRSLSTTTQGRARRSNPPLSYPLIDRSSRERKVRTAGEKYLGPIFATPDSRSISMRDSLGIPPVSKFQPRASGRLASKRHSGADFFGTNRRKSKKHGFWRGKSSAFENEKFSRFGVWQRNDLADVTSVARFAKPQISQPAVRFSRWL